MSEDALIRLQNLRALGHQPADLVRLIGSSYTYWRDLLAGQKSFGEKAARNIEAKLGLVRGCLDSADGCAARAPSGRRAKAGAAAQVVTGQGDLEIVQYETGGAMGNGGLVLEERQPGIIKSWRVDHEWLRLNVRHYTSAANLCIVTGFGPSMQPRFNPGDPLLVDQGITSIDSGDGVYFFRVEKHGYIKQLQRIPTESGLLIRARSFNPDYEPFNITSKMDFEIFGKVLTIWKSEQV